MQVVQSIISRVKLLCYYDLHVGDLLCVSWLQYRLVLKLAIPFCNFILAWCIIDR